ncbi:Pectate lyase superfamily protein [Loktanella fryxellensis]|uniref:Pectate lyase superfamily protein n=1 Tax=Loktanella fryxellensis TaxID=245187 RepID=A0A1H8AHB8_9RHOB|nr:glycosyl hydrolase family 28-related protein [Loktanella fryxellensis]SEM70011.1 Pectate lyase superfamily protein [Loktanella fryxellensis]
MNKAITDGIVFQPLPFAAGLGVWSSGDGTPGSDTYATSGTGVFVPADQDFGGALEVQKTATVQKLRYMGETPILRGCYLRITARVKAVAGPLPSVRIAGWAGRNGGGAAVVPVSVGPQTQLSTYGAVVEVSAIVGSGDRTGVDLVWGAAAYGHFGVDLTGPSGGLVRIDDIVIEDVTVAFQRDMMAMVDVRDYGAKGDNVADDSAAFEAADAAAAGREILVPAGVYRLAQDVTIQNRIRFQGRVTQQADKRFILQKDFDYQTYVDAFGNEVEAFRKAYQALLNFADHESLDLNGRRITLTAPIDMQACDPLRTTFATRRVIRNGQIEAAAGAGWDTVSVTSQATYSAGNAATLTNVINVANIAVGALVLGAGVGREVYVTSTNVAARTVRLSGALYDAAGTQTFTFRRFKYLLDFSGYASLSQFILADMEFQCAGLASGILLAPDGLTFHLRDSFVNRPKDRGVTSPGTGCQGMMVDRCQFLSNEQSLRVQDRTTTALNSNTNDAKIRDNRIVLFRHFAVLAGGGALITGNHWFHGDTQNDGVRRGGLVFTQPNCRAAVTGNYIDNCFIEWTNESDANPAYVSGLTFGGLTVTGNHFVCIDVSSAFTFIVVKPYGPGHAVQGLSVTGNVFRTFEGNIDRVETVDTTFADLDRGRMRQVSFAGNVFHGVTTMTANPAVLTHTQATAATSWVARTDPYLPFLGRARFVDAVVADGPLTTAGGAMVNQMPWADNLYSADQRDVRFVFDQALKGTIRYTVRMDNPI